MADDEKIAAHDGLSSPWSNEQANEKTAGLPGVVVVTEDPAAPSKEVSSRRQRLSDIFTIVGSCSQYSLLKSWLMFA